MTFPAALDEPSLDDAARTARSPRLTRLDVHGFKSFATRTSFVFEPGITAIVGPNGSGKSNVADAVRWVLGEQGQSALRARRTEDVIFAGGQGRAPAGLAEATLTFDNSERWLPIDFTEVTVTRRAFRSGENQYLINGRRVRLKDVALLTASLGQSHVVVGQGLVDAALSQKADERRALFEHAADLAGLRLKVAEAERNLSETEANSERLNDLMTELEPRLRSLERAARQAREWQALSDRLQSLQRAHFGRLLTVAIERERAAAAMMAERAEALSHAQAELTRLEAEVGATASAAEQARQALTSHDAQRLELGERLRTAEHERDLTGERAAALARRFDDMAETQASLEERAAAVAAEQEQVASELTRIEHALHEAATEALTRDQFLRAQRQRRQEQDRRLAALAATRSGLEREVTDVSRRQALLAQQSETARAERARLQDAATETRDRLVRLSRELEEADGGERMAASRLLHLDEQLAELAATTEQAASRLESVNVGLVECERQVGQASARLEALSRMHQTGAGLHAGVREVLAASDGGALAGIIGPVAGLIESPPELETAVEIALGGHLQDVVVERWPDAEAAIEHLKRTRTGRATFQPLDTVRGYRGQVTRVERALLLPGSRGVAADLVGSADRLRPVVEALLGRTLIVDDMPTARRALPDLPPGWSAVTLAGEIARSGGSVTGGTATRESGLLARERELRELPVDIRRLDEDRSRSQRERDDAAAEVAALERTRREVLAERAALAAAGQERTRQRDRLLDWVVELQAELDRRDDRLRQIERKDQEVKAEHALLAKRETELQTSLMESNEEAASLASERQHAEAAFATAEREAAELSRRQAGLTERRRGEQRRDAELRNQGQALTAELQLRAERAATLQRERGSLADLHVRLTGEAEQLRVQLTALTDARFPLHAEVRRIEAAVARSAKTLDAASDNVLGRERAHGGSELAWERARDEAGAIRRQVRLELDIEDADRLIDAGPGAGDGDDGDEAREREINRLRERLRRVGFVGQDVVADFERESAHQLFVRQQLDDVQGAALSLRGLLADLHQSMRTRFDATFAQVSEVFSEVFATLFGGGGAQLILTGGERSENEARAEPGVDIVAQPPGKRLQNLALLSGGERALTAAALLFAILRVNPAPFCLLDEVDAALDEANVVRFRDQLSALAAKTQVVIVTHNRGTIETADTLYGVSMGPDGVSSVLSLRMVDVD